jgi:hypothetical protein
MNYSQAWYDAAFVGGIQALLDAGGSAAPAYLLVYNGTQPSAGASASGSTLLTTMVMAYPATSLIAHKLTLAQGNLAGDFVTTQGVANWARLMNGNNVWIADGSVSATSGDFIVTGTTSTLLYAGARAILGLTRWG